MLEVTGITVLIAGLVHVIRITAVLVWVATMVLVGRYDHSES